MTGMRRDDQPERLTYSVEEAATVLGISRAFASAPADLTRRNEWSPPFGEPFGACLRDLDARGGDRMLWGLDIGCAVEDGGFTVTRDPTTYVMKDIDHSEAAVALIYFVMRLLRQLQAVGSAPAIDYDAYLRSVPGTP